MFKILSTKKYKALKDGVKKQRELLEDLWQKRSDEISTKEQECLKIKDEYEKIKQYVGILRSERDKYKEGYDKYKTLYLDELQKRLDLADKVMWIEQERPTTGEDD